MGKENPNRLELTGYFISFTEEEVSWINKRLETLGYSSGIDGIKEVLFDSLDEESEEEQSKKRRGKAEKFVVDNQELIKMGLGVLGNIMKKAGK